MYRCVCVNVCIDITYTVYDINNQISYSIRTHASVQLAVIYKAMAYYECDWQRAYQKMIWRQDTQTRIDLFPSKIRWLL